MKIGLDAKRAFHNFRGLGSYTRTLIEGLIEFYPQINLKLYTPAPDDMRGKSWLESISSKKNNQNKNILLEVCTPKSFFSWIFPSLWRSFFLSQDFIEKKLDIYHGTSGEIPFLVPIRNKRKYKFVVTIHDLIFMRYPQHFSFIDRIVYRIKNKRSCHNADLVLSICEHTKKDLIEFFGIKEEKIRVVYQACHPRFYQKLGITERVSVLAPYGISSRYILFVGAIEENKNVFRAVKAFQKITKEFTHNFIIIGKGKGDYLTEIETFINKENLTSRVKILENINNEQLPAFYQGADLFFYPSLYEGFGLPIVEALFSGMPVLTSHGSSFPESAGPHSVYITPEDVDEMSFKMRRILEDVDLRNKMSQKGLEYVQRFHWKETTQTLINLYKELLEM